MKKETLLSLSALACLSIIICLFMTSNVARSEEKKQDTILLTIFLKHDQSKTLEKINAHLEKPGFWKKFPPEAPRLFPGTS